MRGIPFPRLAIPSLDSACANLRWAIAGLHCALAMPSNAHAPQTIPVHRPFESLPCSAFLCPSLSIRRPSVSTRCHGIPIPSPYAAVHCHSYPLQSHALPFLCLPRHCQPSPLPRPGPAFRSPGIAWPRLAIAFFASPKQSVSMLCLPDSVQFHSIANPP